MALKDTKKKDWQVVKANEFIQCTQNDLSKMQLKLVAYIFSTIHKDDNDFTVFKLSTQELITLMDNTLGGRNYNSVKNALKTIADKSWWVDTGKSEELVRFFDTIKIDKETGLITGKIAVSLKPYLIDFERKFTSYPIVTYLSLKSEYSMRLYEYLKSYQSQKYLRQDIDIIKNKIHATATTYDTYKRFNDKVLKPAIAEINEKTDIKIAVTPYKIKGSRSYTHLDFVIVPHTRYFIYGVFDNVYLTDEEANIIVYEWYSKHLIDDLSRYKFRKQKTNKKGDFATITRWYKKKLKEQEEQQRARASEEAEGQTSIYNWLEE